MTRDGIWAALDAERTPQLKQEFDGTAGGGGNDDNDGVADRDSRVRATVHALAVRGLRKVYGKSAVPAVDDVDLVVQPGELLVLLGPSGCGKTTLLRCIAGLEKPTAGDILVGQRTVFSHSQRTFVQPNDRHVGMMFQSFALWPHMTVLQNIAYPLRRRKVPRAEHRPRVMDLLKNLGLDGLAERHPGELSGGQQQRVALARALVGAPEVLLFDEPLSSVDAKVRRSLRAQIRELNEQLGFAGIYVTHDQNEAMELADTLVVMGSGKVLQSGKPTEVYRRPNCLNVADFLGGLNTVPARVTEADGVKVLVETDLGSIRLHVGHPVELGTDGHIGIRPEATRFDDGAATPEIGADRMRAEGVVQRVVDYGNRVEIVVRAGEYTFTIAMQDSTASLPREGERVQLALPREELRWLSY